MRDRTLDRRLSAAFTRALALSPERQDGLWQLIAAERRDHEQAWAAFGSAMLQLPEQLGLAMRPPRRPSVWELLGVRVGAGRTEIRLLGVFNASV